MNYCPTCGGMMWGDNKTHTCRPQWEVRIPQWDDDTITTVYAVDAEGAAEEVTEACNPEGDAVDGPVRVLVRRVGTRDWQAFDVTAEASVVYSAEEVDPEEEEEGDR